MSAGACQILVKAFAYSFLWCHGVEVPIAMKWVDAIPGMWPLSLLGEHCFLESTSMMSTPIQMNRLVSTTLSQSNAIPKFRLLRVRMTKMSTHSTGFLRLSKIASNAHNRFSTCGEGSEPTTPLSISCGPKCDILGGKAALKRERNITRNCQ